MLFEITLTWLPFPFANLTVWWFENCPVAQGRPPNQQQVYDSHQAALLARPKDSVQSFFSEEELFGTYLDELCFRLWFDGEVSEEEKIGAKPRDSRLVTEVQVIPLELVDHSLYTRLHLKAREEIFVHCDQT